MLWVLKRTVSMRQLFWAPETYVKAFGEENIYNYFTFKNSVYLWYMIAFLKTSDYDQKMSQSHTNPWHHKEDTLCHRQTKANTYNIGPVKQNYFSVKMLLFSYPSI